MNKISPRAKCDQVVYEAIAKITEIIVRSRCGEDDLCTSEKNSSDRSRSGSVGGYSSCKGSSTTVSSSSARFNLEIGEVESIRSILQMWKKSLHVPLRLDIYYEFSLDGDSPTRKELLERWCIDYVASHNDYPCASNLGGNSVHADDITQLRQVCKRVMVMLRTLYSFLRLMPAFSLHQGLEALKLRYSGVTLNKFSRGIHGMGDHETGYYSQQTNVAPQTSYEMISSLCGRVLFSFHASEVDTGSSDATFLSLNAPFSRRDLNSIPTPFGQLNLSVLYDSCLKIGRVLNEATERISRRRSNAIPIERLVPSQMRSINFQEPNMSSVPVATADYDAAHRHIIHDYATSPSLRSRSFSPHLQRSKAIINKSKSTLTDHEILRQEATENKIFSGERVLSGISLALMNEQGNPTETMDQYSPRKHANSSDEFILSKQRRAFHQPPPNMTSSSLLQTSSGLVDHTFHHPSLQAYGYNHGRIITAPICIISAEKTTTEVSIPVNTPPAPAFLGSTPRLTGSLPLTDETSTVLPPFRNPLELVESKTKLSSESAYTGQSLVHTSLGHYSQDINPILPPLSSLDVLTSNPFTSSSERSGMSSCLYFSAVTRQSVSILQNYHDDTLSDMPFAIQSDSEKAPSIDTQLGCPRPNIGCNIGSHPLFYRKLSGDDSSSNLADSEALTTLASRCLSGSRLRIFDSTDGLNNGGIRDRSVITDISTLRSELEKFRSFGDSLAST